MEFVARDVDRLDLIVGHLDTLRIQVSVDLAADFEAGLGGCGSDQLHDHLVAYQRLATPVHGDEGEQPMLDPVPLAGAGWQMSDRDPQPCLVGDALEFALP
jgi:hypothetical protein